MTNEVFQTATELATRIAKRQVSAEAVLEAHLECIARHNPALNAIVTLDEEGARKRAREIDAAPPGDRPSLWGVPITLKDAFMVQGMRSTGGYPPLADYVPEVDSAVAARLRAAGAIILGKTNVPILSTDTQTHNEIFGRTDNPWNHDRTPGGSSGGSAAAVASGMVPLDIGTDIAGSVRIPAHYCGIYSLKPTEYRVSTAGVIPPVLEQDTPRRVRRIQVAGPMTRSVGDLELTLRVIAGADSGFFEVPPVPLGEADAPPLEKMHIAWTNRFGHVPVTEDTERVLAGVIEQLAKCGCTVSKQMPEGFKFPELWEVFGAWYWAEVGAEHAPDEDATIAEEAGFTPDSDDAFSRGAGRAVHASMRLYHEIFAQRDHYIAAFDHLLDDWDVFICPVAATPATPHIPHMSNVTVAGQVINYFECGTYYCIPFNLTGHPVVVIPAGYADDGLPIGVQLVGRRWGEMRLLAIARQIDSIVGAYRQPPGC